MTTCLWNPSESYQLWRELGLPDQLSPYSCLPKWAALAPVRSVPFASSLITTARLEFGQSHLGNALISAAQVAAIDIDVVRERRAWDPSVVRLIARAVAARRPHIVETHQVKSHFLLAQATLWGGLRRDFAWIAYHHGYTRATLKLTLYEELDRWTLRRADHVVTVCKPFAMQLRKRGVKAERLSVISNAIQPRETPKLANSRDYVVVWALTQQTVCSYP